jgi:DNA-directed RNA polymerase subunit RPC12/RpoP
MMRPIDADALLTVPNVNWVYQYDETGEYIKYKAIPVETIEKAPTLDLAPVVHGEWVFTETFADITFYKCSICSNDIGVDPFFDDKVSNFCPNCGAKMDGKAV